MRRMEGLFALDDQLEERLAKARGQVDPLNTLFSPVAWLWQDSPPGILRLYRWVFF